MVGENGVKKRVALTRFKLGGRLRPSAYIRSLAAE